MTGEDSLVALIVELDESERRGECEEQEHRVEQDEPGDTQPSDIYAGQRGYKNTE